MVTRDLTLVEARAYIDVLQLALEKAQETVHENVHPERHLPWRECSTGTCKRTRELLELP